VKHLLRELEGYGKFGEMVRSDMVISPEAEKNYYGG